MVVGCSVKAGWLYMRRWPNCSNPDPTSIGYARWGRRWRVRRSWWTWWWRRRRRHRRWTWRC